MGIKLLLVDDHPVVRQGVRRMLEAEGDMVVMEEASSGEEALERLEAVSVDIVLMDIKMNGMSGIETVRRIKERFPEVNVVILTFYGDQYMSPAIEAGAAGYLVKDIGGQELVQAVRKVYGGQSILHDSLSREFFSEFASMARGQGNHRCTLKQREMEMIRLIASGATNKEIAAQLFLSETTVKRDISHIFEKLDSRDRAEAVSESYKRGLL